MGISQQAIERLPTTGTISSPTQAVLHGYEQSTPMANRATRSSVLLVFLVIAGCDRRKNVCPIDGQPPEWVGRRNGQSCEYLHYSVVEKKTHSWWADCAKDGA